MHLKYLMKSLKIAKDDIGGFIFFYKTKSKIVWQHLAGLAFILFLKFLGSDTFSINCISLRKNYTSHVVKHINTR